MRPISCSETSISNYQYTLRNITEENRLVAFQYPAHDNNYMSHTRIYEAKGLLVTIQGPQRMSGKISSNKHSFPQEKFCVIKKNCRSFSFSGSN
jgi:hypothetical protein